MATPARIIDHQTKELQSVAPVAGPMASALAFMAQGGSVEQLNQMLDLQDRWEANEARKAFTVAMAGFKAEPVTIYKRKEVAFLDVKYNHAELSDVTDAIGMPLAKHQLSYRWDIHQEGTIIRVDCILTHVLGHSVTVTMSGSPDSSGKKNAIQQIASTTTYLQRYTLLAITGMSTKGMDDDGRGADAPPASDEPLGDSGLDWVFTAKSIDSLEEYKIKKDEVVAAYGANKVPKQVLAAFNAAFRALKASK